MQVPVGGLRLRNEPRSASGKPVAEVGFGVVRAPLASAAITDFVTRANIIDRATWLAKRTKTAERAVEKIEQRVHESISLCAQRESTVTCRGRRRCGPPERGVRHVVQSREERSQSDHREGRIEGLQALAE